MLAGCDSLLHAIDVADGKEVFTVQIDGPTAATAAMRGNRAYFGTEGAIFYAVDVDNAEGKTPDVVWTYKDPRRTQPIRSAAAVTSSMVVFGSQARAVIALNPQSGEELWKVTTRSRVDSSPVIVGNRVVAATSSGKLYLLDAKDGAVEWETELGGGFSGSAAVVDGKLIIANTDGTLYCFGSKSENTNK
jgi:outer membrane protein assembly factor BamB